MSALRAARREPAWPYIVEDGGRLADPATDEEAPAIARLVHDAFGALIESAAFPCAGARTVAGQGSWRMGMMGALAGPGSAEALAEGLLAFAAERRASNEEFHSYVAFFTSVVGGEEEFEALLWRQLQQLHYLDREPWDPRVSAEPRDPAFSFSFGGEAYFLVGMHPASSRWSRRFAWPALVFNPHEQFQSLRADGRMEPWQQSIRARDVELQGSVNPNLSDFGDLPEASQYSGRRTPRDWRCPFEPRRR